MANDRKLLTADALSLKEKVRAEMLRRSYSGSVADYGGSGYDFSTPPRTDGPVLGEHLKKNLEPMQAVNGDGLPVYPGPLTRAGQEVMETKINVWKARSITDRSGSDCKNGCTGMCYTTCQTGCYNTCTSCTGCSGCSGCGGGCGSGCRGECETSCTACGSQCVVNCTSCRGDCYGGTR